MDQVECHLEAEVAADRAGRCLDRVRRTDHLARGRDRLGTLEHRGDQRAAGDELDQLAEEGLLGVLLVVDVGDLHGRLDQPQVGDPQALALEAGEDLAGQPALERVGLDQDQGAVTRPRGRQTTQDRDRDPGLVASYSPLFGRRVVVVRRPSSGSSGCCASASAAASLGARLVDSASALERLERELESLGGRAARARVAGLAARAARARARLGCAARATAARDGIRSRCSSGSSASGRGPLRGAAGLRRAAARLLGARTALGLGRRSSAAARRVGVSQYGQTDHRGSIGLPQDSHGSLIRALQLGQRR